jgi:hypothetical protein
MFRETLYQDLWLPTQDLRQSKDKLLTSSSGNLRGFAQRVFPSPTRQRKLEVEKIKRNQAEYAKFGENGTLWLW